MRACRWSSRRPRTTRSRARANSLAAPLGIVLGLLLVTAAYLWALGGPGAHRVAAIGGSYELTAANGQTVTDRSFAGRYRLIYFGYSACRDICPTTLNEVGRAMDLLGDRAPSIQPLFITVDPEHDTPEVLRSYLSAFTPRLIGLTGTPVQIHTVQREYRLASTIHPNTAGRGYVVDHGSVLYLMGPDGRYVAPIRADETGAEMATDIARHLS